MGWLVEDKKVYNYVIMAGVTENLDINSKNSGIYTKYACSIDQLKTDYERTYPKLQVVLAQIQAW